MRPPSAALLPASPSADASPSPPAEGIHRTPRATWESDEGEGGGEAEWGLRPVSRNPSSAASSSGSRTAFLGPPGISSSPQLSPSGPHANTGGSHPIAHRAHHHRSHHHHHHHHDRSSRHDRARSSAPTPNWASAAAVASPAAPGAGTAYLALTPPPAQNPAAAAVLPAEAPPSAAEAAAARHLGRRHLAAHQLYHSASAGGAVSAGARSGGGSGGPRALAATASAGGTRPGSAGGGGLALQSLRAHPSRVYPEVPGLAPPLELDTASTLGGEVLSQRPAPASLLFPAPALARSSSPGGYPFGNPYRAPTHAHSSRHLHQHLHHHHHSASAGGAALLPAELLLSADLAAAVPPPLPPLLPLATRLPPLLVTPGAAAAIASPSTSAGTGTSSASASPSPSDSRVSRVTSDDVEVAGHDQAPPGGAGASASFPAAAAAASALPRSRWVRPHSSSSSSSSPSRSQRPLPGGAEASTTTRGGPAKQPPPVQMRQLADDVGAGAVDAVGAGGVASAAAAAAAGPGSLTSASASAADAAGSAPAAAAPAPAVSPPTSRLQLSVTVLGAPQAPAAASAAAAAAATDAARASGGGAAAAAPDAAVGVPVLLLPHTAAAAGGGGLLSHVTVVGRPVAPAAAGAAGGAAGGPEPGIDGVDAVAAVAVTGTVRRRRRGNSSGGGGAGEGDESGAEEEVSGPCALPAELRRRLRVALGRQRVKRIRTWKDLSHSMAGPRPGYWLLGTLVVSLALLGVFAFMAGQYEFLRDSATLAAAAAASAAAPVPAAAGVGAATQALSWRPPYPPPPFPAPASAISTPTPTSAPCWGPRCLCGWLSFWRPRPARTFSFDYLRSWGGRYGPDLAGGQWWRWLSSLLLHASPLHLASNLALLLVLSSYLESLYGAWRVLPVWLLAGVAGNMASAFFEDPCTLVVGSSGAVFGLLGAYVADAAVNWESLPLLWLRLLGVAGLGGFMLALQLTDHGGSGGGSGGPVSNASHAGGFVVGLLAALAVTPDFKARRAAKVRRLLAGLGLESSLPEPATPAGRQLFSFWQRHRYLLYGMYGCAAAVLLLALVGVPLQLYLRAFPHLTCESR